MRARDEGMGQVGQPRRPGLLAGQPPVAVRRRARRRVPGIAPRDGEPPPSSVAALLTSAPSSTIARHEPLARHRGRSAAPSRSAPDDVDLHREPERGRAIDRRRARAAPRPPRPSPPPSPPAATGTHQPMEPGPDDRLGRAADRTSSPSSSARSAPSGVVERRARSRPSRASPGARSSARPSRPAARVADERRSSRRARVSAPASRS